MPVYMERKRKLFLIERWYCIFAYFYSVMDDKLLRIFTLNTHTQYLTMNKNKKVV